MADEGPSKTDLQTVFRRLKGNAANKVCFDCGARNPTWASVTYGVFICIDCSATHRGLGVHITFVRSTNLDTNWTWLQLRAMQLGGNGNATQFFKVHGCNTGDAQQKYRSRAAALYRDKLLQMSTQAHRLHGPGNLMLDIAPLSPEITADVDFFAEHTAEFPDNGDLPHNTSSASISADAYIGPDVEEGEASLKFPDNGDLSHNTSSASISADAYIGPDVEEGEGPNVDHVIGDDDQPVTMSSLSQKSVIAKKPVKKATLGAKKGGLGAQRIKTDFEQIEQKATDFDKVKDSSSKLMMQEEETVIDSDKKKSGVAQLSARLTMQSIDEQHKAHEKMKAADPSKAEVVDRLGMGGGRLGRPAGVSHSIASGIKPIKQEGSSVVNKKGQPSSFRDLGDQWEIIGKDTVTPKNNEDNDYLSTKTKDDEFFDAWDTAPPVEEKKPITSRPTPRTTTTSQMASSRLAVASGDDVQKKFGNAKAISSEQYFGGDQMDYETKSNLTKFEGSTGIGSSDLFGNGQSKDSSSSRFSGMGSHVPEMADIKDSVRQGVSKVAGKISSLSSSMSSYLGRPPQKH